MSAVKTRCVASKRSFHTSRPLKLRGIRKKKQWLWDIQNKYTFVVKKLAAYSIHCKYMSSSPFNACSNTSSQRWSMESTFLQMGLRKFCAIQIYFHNYLCTDYANLNQQRIFSPHIFNIIHNENPHHQHISEISKDVGFLMFEWRFLSKKDHRSLFSAMNGVNYRNFRFTT